MGRSLLVVGAVATFLFAATAAVSSASAHSSGGHLSATRRVEIVNETSTYASFYAYNPGNPSGGISEGYKWSKGTKSIVLSSSGAWIIDAHEGVSASTGPYKTTVYVPAGKRTVVLYVHADGSDNWSYSATP